MDLLFIAGIAIIGHELNNKQKKKISSNLDTAYENVPLKSSHMISENENKMKTLLDAHLKNPNVIGNHNLLPFFKSEKSQNTNDELKDTRLSMFTGVNNFEFNNKKEVESFIDKEYNQTNANLGSKSQPIEQDRYIPSTLQTNALPFEQIKVGPGIGVSNNIVSDGGFHSHFRIKPNNINDYRKNNFQGRLIGGKNIIDKPTNNSDIQYFDKTVSQCQRPTMPVKSHLSSQTTLSNNDIQKLTSRGESSYSFQYNVQNNSNNEHLNTNSTRTYDSSKCAIPGNPHTHQTMSFSEPKFLIHDTERENCNQVTNAHKQNNGSMSQYSDDVRPTMRSTKNDWVGIANNTNVHKYNDVLDINLKETKRINDCNYNGIISGNQKFFNSYTNTDTFTKKDKITQNQMNRDDTIQGSLYIPRNKEYITNYNQSISKELLCSSHTPNISRINLINDPCETNGITRVNFDNNVNNTININKLDSIHNFTNCNHMGSVYVPNKPIISNAIDFESAKVQLQDNPYSLNILQK